MSELYKIADKLLAELARMEKSGADKATILQYKMRILDYIDESYRH